MNHPIITVCSIIALLVLIGTIAMQVMEMKQYMMF